LLVAAVKNEQGKECGWTGQAAGLNVCSVDEPTLTKPTRCLAEIGVVQVAGATETTLRAVVSRTGQASFSKKEEQNLRL
jgi:hypothetical protein